MLAWTTSRERPGTRSVSGRWRTRRTRRDRDAAEDPVGLIREAGGVEERRQGLIGVTVAKHQRPQAGDGQCSTVSDGEPALGGCQCAAVGSEDIYLAVAKIADQQIPCQRTKSRRGERHSPGR